MSIEEFKDLVTKKIKEGIVFQNFNFSAEEFFSGEWKNKVLDERGNLTFH